ncbi:MAG: nucleoside hydrolase [Ignavibacteriae bacterium]|nr:nucleoside hydrolase [Ignavibacteriota bacterium]
MPKPILIDTDTGVDDALALIVALRSPELAVRTITTVAGNVEVRKCTRNVLMLLELLHAGENITVAEGAPRPLKRKLFSAPEVHGKDGLGNITLHKKFPVSRRRVSLNGIEEIISFCKVHGKKGSIVALGPLTNIARAFLKNPAALRGIGSIVTMGGAFRVPGNTGPVAEFNYYVDPEAAHIVLNSGLPITVVPLDLTERIALMRKEFEYRASRRASPVANAVLRFTKLYMAYHKRTEGFNGGYAHDPIAVVVAIDPAIVSTRPVSVAVETSGELTRGMTVADFRKPRATKVRKVNVALSINREKFLKLFHERLWK